MLTEYSWQANTALSHSRHLQVWPEPGETRTRAKKFMMDMLCEEQKCFKGGRFLCSRNWVDLVISEMGVLVPMKYHLGGARLCFCKI